jgi:hypothetical protein
MARETDARMVIDQLLKDAGWDIFDRSQVSTEEHLIGYRGGTVRDGRNVQPGWPTWNRTALRGPLVKLVTR